MSKYVLVKGKFTMPNKDGERISVQVGETVELTDAQAASFKEFFKPHEVYMAELKVIEASAKAASPAESTDSDKKPAESTDSDKKPAEGKK